MQLCDILRARRDPKLLLFFVNDIKERAWIFAPAIYLIFLVLRAKGVGDSDRFILSYISLARRRSLRYV
jgi:hypothetical protein